MSSGRGSAGSLGDEPRALLLIGRALERGELELFELSELDVGVHLDGHFERPLLRVRLVLVGWLVGRFVGWLGGCSVLVLVLG